LIIENTPGANGSLAVSSVLRAKPDGYTLLGTTGSDFILAPETIGSARYRPDDFKFVGAVGTSDFILLSSKNQPFTTISGLIAYSRKVGTKELTLAHWGLGSSPHIVGADFQARTGLKFLEVPYKGAAPVITDLLGGHIDLAFAPLGGGTLGLIETGQVTALAIASAKRHPALPMVPTVSESLGLSKFEYSIWSGLFAPPGTPDEVVARLTEAVNAWVKSDENETRIATNASGRLYPMTTDESAAFFKTESEKFHSVSKTLSLDRQ
jgi:tripartite-type tricarboxylate transporter receptor subunit TctC